MYKKCYVTYENNFSWERWYVKLRKNNNNEKCIRDKRIEIWNTFSTSPKCNFDFIILTRLILPKYLILFRNGIYDIWLPWYFCVHHVIEKMGAIDKKCNVFIAVIIILTVLEVETRLAQYTYNNKIYLHCKR